MESNNVNICSDCKVAVDAALKRCPLCKRSLALTSGENGLYPPLIKEGKHKKRSFTGELFLFLTVTILVGCCILNALFWNGSIWITAVSSITLYLWILIRGTILSDMYGGFKIGLQMLGVILMLISFDFANGWQGWSINTGLPVTLACGMAVFDYFSYIHKARWKDNLICAVFYLALCFVPLIFYFSHITTEIIPAVISATMGAVTILGILRFTVRKFKAEMGKRFHI